MSDAATVLTREQGVFKGADGLERFAECQEFWDEQPYGTRLYFGPNGDDYLHRDVLRAAVKALANPGIASRLEELMRRCREDVHEISYQDLLDVKGKA